MADIEVVFTDYIEDDLEWEQEVLGSEDIDFKAYQLKGEPESKVYEKIKLANVIVCNMVEMPRSLIGRLKHCRLIIRHGIGYDNVDVEACTQNNIQFANQPDYCTADVAEHAITLLFSSARRLFNARRTLQKSSEKGEWDFSDLFPLYRMEGKVVGIIGLGRIGCLVAQKLQSFGFELIATDPYVKEKAFKELRIQQVDLDTLLYKSDYITIHTPLNLETRNLINDMTLEKMKETAVIINTARGPIVDAEALAQALEWGTIAGAAIDVYEAEPPPLTHPLFGRENVILTPHMSWASAESGKDIRKSIVDDVLNFAKGGNARNIVNNITFNEHQIQ